MAMYVYLSCFNCARKCKNWKLIFGQNYMTRASANNMIYGYEKYTAELRVNERLTFVAFTPN